MITAGIDCGAKKTQAVILQKGQIIGKAMLPSGCNQEKTAQEPLAQAAKYAAIAKDDLQNMFVTGSVRIES